MKKTIYLTLLLGLISVISLMTSCSKNAEKIAGTYTGTLEKNDSVVSNDSQIVIREVSKNTVLIESPEFENYEVEIDKQRYFNSKSYYSTDPNEQLEVFDDGNMTLLHNDANGNQYTFVGSR